MPDNKHISTLGKPGFKLVVLALLAVLYATLYFWWEDLGLKRWILLVLAACLTPELLRVFSAKLELTGEGITRTSYVGVGPLVLFGRRSQSIRWSDVVRVSLFPRNIVVWYPIVVFAVRQDESELDLDRMNINALGTNWRSALRFALKQVPPQSVESDVWDLAYPSDHEGAASN